MSGQAPPQGVLQNIVQVLQEHPTYYRNFGPWWWPLKRILKRAGFDRHNLQVLGDHDEDDERLHEMTDGLTDVELVTRALEAQEYSAKFTPGGPNQYWPDGEPYHLIDPDG